VHFVCILCLGVDCACIYVVRNMNLHTSHFSLKPQCLRIILISLSLRIILVVSSAGVCVCVCVWFLGDV
jgi:hypothetical protein